MPRLYRGRPHGGGTMRNIPIFAIMLFRDAVGFPFSLSVANTATTSTIIPYPSVVLRKEMPIFANRFFTFWFSYGSSAISIFLRSNATTLSTRSAERSISSSILRRELMSFVAMGRAVPTTVFGLPSGQILKKRDSFEVVGINTRGVSTEVVNNKPFWYRPSRLNVREPVCYPSFFVSGKLPISPSGGTGSPVPTGISLLNFVPKSLHEAFVRTLHFFVKQEWSASI